MQTVIPSNPQDWQAYYELRWRILRAPWQQAKGSERDELEQQAYHIMVKTEAGDVVGVGRIHRNSCEEWQVRYMALLESYRGKGIGAMTLQELERHANSLAAKRIVLNARESAVKFYLRYNYQVVADAPTLFGVIKHQRMEKHC